MTGHNRHIANAFASTFYFFSDTPSNAKKIKRACKPTHQDSSKTGRHSDNEEKALLVTAVWRNGGCSASYDSFVVSSSAVLRLNFCAKNPPLRQAAKRQAVKKVSFRQKSVDRMGINLVIRCFRSTCFYAHNN